MKIRFIQPFAVDKNIGKCYNEECSRADADDWICITDQDSCFLHPFNGKQLYDIVQTTGKDYTLLSCVTNRLKASGQLYQGRFEESGDMYQHTQIAEELFDTKYDIVRRVPFPVAGLLLLFPKKTWEKYKFAENSYMFDMHFSWDILRTNGKIGLMEGVYRYHNYRLGSADPKRDTKHLEP